MEIEINDNERTLLHKSLLLYNLKKDITKEEKETIKNLLVKIYQK